MRDGVRLFVYGTLRAGEPAHAELAGARALGPATTAPRYTLHDLSAYPALVEGGQHPVRGELWLVAPEALAAIDRYEGHPDLFRRSPIELANGEHAEAYLLPRARVAGHPVIASGDWCTRR